MRKKIAFFMYDMRTGGVETVLVNTIDALLAQDVEITLYSHRKIIEPVHIEWLKKHPDVCVVVYYPLARFFDKQNRKHPIIRALKRICFGIYRSYRNLLMASRVRRQHFDAIIDYISGYSAKPLRKIKDVLKITWVHCSMNYFRDNNLISGLVQYDKIVTISDSFLKEFIRKYPQYATRAVRIYNPINFAQIHEKIKTGKIISGKYFSCVSRLDADKDIPTLLRAFDDFYKTENKPDVNLYIVGDGDKRAEFTDMAKKLSSSSNIIFVGKQSNPFVYMNGAMAHILSSFNEGLPTVLIESMATGTVNISSNCPNGPHEILLNGDAGFLFEPGNAKELSKIMSDVFHKRVDIDKKKKCATKSLSRFDSGNIASQIIDLINGEQK